MMKLRQSLLLASAMLLVAGAAQAAPVIFSGQDDGADIGGPFPFSAAAQSGFLASASGFGPTATATYENLPVGNNPSYSLGQGVSVSLNSPYGYPFTGVLNTQSSNVYGFNTTNGGSNWLGFAGGSATFTFSSTTYSFGTYLTGLQTIFTSPGDLTFSFNGTDGQVLSAPVNTNGGAQYFGFTDAAGFTSVTITNQTSDAWGIDDTSFNVSSVPLPASAPMFGAALLALGVAGYGLKRRKGAAAAA